MDEANDLDNGHESQEVSDESTDDLDALLAEYDNRPKEPESEIEPPSSYEPENLIDDDRWAQVNNWAQNVGGYVQALVVRETEREVNEALDQAAEHVKKELGREGLRVGHDYLKKVLLNEAQINDRFVYAFQNRQIDPQYLERQLEKIGSSVAKDISGMAVDIDREAVAAAVLGSNSVRDVPEPGFPSADQLRTMSDSDFTKIWERQK